MLLQDIFQPGFIKVNLEATDKNKAFEELADYFCRAGNVNIRKEILIALKDREAKMSTGIQKGIAIPHGKTSAVDSICGAVGISRSGVDYDALDGEPVYLLFMIVTPQNDSEANLRILKRLAGLIENQKFFTDILTQKDAQGVFDIICQYENELTL